MAGTFSGKAVVESFKHAEGMLEEFIRAVPYCPAHEGVWSPQLVTILLEACSQLDSLWKAEFREAGRTKKKPDIRSFSSILGGKVAKRWLVFWGWEAEKIQPFREWDGARAYKPLPWWNAYNAVKHDRLANREQASLKSAVIALAGLFVAMFQCPYCADDLAQTEWAVPPSRYGNMDAADLYGDSSRVAGIVAESTFFSHPIHAGMKRIGLSVCSKQSYRFQRWCRDNSVRI